MNGLVILKVRIRSNLIRTLTTATLEKKMKYNILPALLITFCGLFSATIPATPFTHSPYVLLAQTSQNINKAAQKIKQQTGGRILSSKSANKNGRMVYKIKVLLPSGKVQIFTVNAK